MKVGYCNSPFGGGTQSYHLIGELKEGGFVVTRMPQVIIRMDGTKYLASSLSGLMIVKDLHDIHEENPLEEMV